MKKIDFKMISNMKSGIEKNFNMIGKMEYEQ